MIVTGLSPKAAHLPPCAIRGIVASLARPGGNITGLSSTASMGEHAKLVQHMHEIVPTSDRIGWIGTRQRWEGSSAAEAMRMGAAQLGITLVPVFTDPVVDASIRRAFAEMSGLNLGGLILDSAAELRVFPRRRCPQFRATTCTREPER